MKEKAKVRQREVPDLPAEWEAPAEPLLPGVKLESLRLDGCVLDGIDLSGAVLGSAVWRDVRLVSCNLANTRAHRLELVRVELIDCRLTGFIAGASDCLDVLIRGADMSFAQFSGGRFRRCEFEACNLREADLQSTELSGALFRSCQLNTTDLRGAHLADADFRTSDVEGMLVGVNDLRGAIVDAPQAMILAKVLGLKIL